MEALKSLFDHHPGTEEFHITSDGIAHFTQQQADAQAEHLADKTINTVTREQVTAAIDRAAAEASGNTEGLEHQPTEEEMKAAQGLLGPDATKEIEEAAAKAGKPGRRKT